MPKKGQSETQQNFFGPSNDPSFTNPQGQKDPKSIKKCLFGLVGGMLPALAAIPQGHKYCTSTSFSSLKLLNKVFMAVKSVSEFISPCKVATGCPFSIQHYSTIIPAPRKPELVRNGASSTCFTHTARSHPRDVFLVFGMFLRTAVCKDWDGSICPVFLVTIQSYLLSAMLFHQGSP